MIPLVTVIVPVFNVIEYVDNCLNSLVNQTLKNIEIIIVNDGSTDGSLNICKKYDNLDIRVRLIEQTNQGLGIARNVGLKSAAGDFISFVDSDDALDLSTLEDSYNKAIRDDAEIVVFGFERISEGSGKTIQIRDDLDFDIEHITKDEFYKKVIGAEFKHMACAMLVKRELFIDHCLRFPSVLHEDLYVTPQLFYYASKVSFIKYGYYKWLVRKGSITSHVSLQHIDGIFAAIFSVKIFLLRENIYEKYKFEFMIFCVTYLRLMYVRIKNNNNNNKTELFQELQVRSRIIITNQDIERLPKITIEKYSGFIQFLGEYNTECDSYRRMKKSLMYCCLLRYYNVRDYLLPHHSWRREVLENFMIVKSKNLSAIKSTKLFLVKNRASLAKKNFDVIFLPHKDYHAHTMSLISIELNKLGISSCLMDMTEHYRDEGTRSTMLNFPSVPFLDLQYLLDNKIRNKALVCMNDWDTKCTRPLAIQAKNAGKKTIGIIEGINDFYDMDIPTDRMAYKTVEYLLMTGEHDRQFFPEKEGKIFVVGIPRLTELMSERPIFSTRPLAVVNVNFSYGILEDKRDMWLQSVIKGCEIAGIDYVITQHPADRGDLSQYNVTEKNMYDAIREGSIVISRFGSIILEALAMGKPAIYHNPHGEQALKFQDPMGAYSLSDDANSLARGLRNELSFKGDYRLRANPFLDLHCCVNRDESSSILASKRISKICNF